MTTKIIDSRRFDSQARRIKVQTTKILAKWGLLPRFKRWRLTQDPDTGMVVLFGVLNNNYIAAHSSIPFGDYFDPRLLRELANEMQVQIVSCNCDSLRYAFVLDRGEFEKLPTHIDFPYIEDGRVSVRVVYNDQIQPVSIQPVSIQPVSIQLDPIQLDPIQLDPIQLVPIQLVPIQAVHSAAPDDIRFLRQVTGAFLKIFDDIKLKDDAALLLAAQNPPDISIINEAEFNKRVLEHEVNRQRVKRIEKLLDNAAG